MSDASVTTRRYVGRFAPSPTGLLHFGSLIAAVASYLQARSHRGLWRVRIENLDPPREQPGAATHTLRTLEAYGFQWDGEVMYQSRRMPVYREAVNDLVSAGHAYYCGCSRTQIEAAGKTGAFGPIYPGTCSADNVPGRRGRSVRVVTHDRHVGFNDEHQGSYEQRLESEVGVLSSAAQTLHGLSPGGSD
jgi:glutamyl-Q tRNA(Asp) synthetase